MLPRALERARSAVARISLVSVRSLTLPEMGFRGLEQAEESGLWPIVFEIRFAKSPIEEYFAFLWASGCCNDTQPVRLSFTKVSNNRMAIRAAALVREGLARYRICFAKTLVKEGSLLVFPIIRNVGTQLHTTGERSGARVISKAPDVRKLYHVRFVFNEELLGARAVIVELKSPVRAVPLTRVTNTMFSRTLALAAGYHLYRFRVLFEKSMRRTSEFPPISIAWNPDDSYSWGIVTEWLVFEIKVDTTSGVKHIHEQQNSLLTYQETKVEDARFISDRFRTSTCCQNDAGNSSKKSASGSQISLAKELAGCESAGKEEGLLSASREQSSYLQPTPVPETTASDRTASADQFSNEYGIHGRNTSFEVWTPPPSSKDSSRTSTSSSGESELRSFQSIDRLMRTTVSQNGTSEFAWRNDCGDPTGKAGLVRENESPDRFSLFPRSSADVVHRTAHTEGSAGHGRLSMPNCISSISGMGEVFRKREYAFRGEQDTNACDGHSEYCNKAQSRTYSTKNDENLHVTGSGSNAPESVTNDSIEAGSSSVSFSESDVSSDEGRAKRFAKMSVDRTNPSASPGEVSSASSSSSRRSFGRFLRRRPRRTEWPFAKVRTNEPPSPSRYRSFPSLRPPLSPMTPIIGSVEPTEKPGMFAAPVFMPPLRFGTNPRHQAEAVSQSAYSEAERKALHGGAPSLPSSTMRQRTEATQWYHPRCPTCGNALSWRHGGNPQSSSGQHAARDGSDQDLPNLPAPAGVPNTSTSVSRSCIAAVENGRSKCNQQASERKDSPGLVSRNSLMKDSVTRCECSGRCFPSGFDRTWNEKKAQTNHAGWRHKVRKILQENGKVILVATLTALGMTLFDLLTVRSTASENSDASNVHDDTSVPQHKAWFY